MNLFQCFSNQEICTLIPFLFVISNPNYAEIKFSTHYKTEIYIQGTHIYKVLSISLTASSPTEKRSTPTDHGSCFFLLHLNRTPSFSISAIKRKATGFDILVKHISTRWSGKITAPLIFSWQASPTFLSSLALA